MCMCMHMHMSCIITISKTIYIGRKLFKPLRKATRLTRDNKEYPCTNMLPNTGGLSTFLLLDTIYKSNLYRSKNCLFIFACARC